MTILVQFLSIVAAAVGVAGIFTANPVTTVVGAIFSFLLCLESFCANVVETKVLSIIGCVIGMFVCRFALHMGWGMGLATATCWVMLVLSVSGLIHLLHYKLVIEKK